MAAGIQAPAFAGRVQERTTMLRLLTASLAFLALGYSAMASILVTPRDVGTGALLIKATTPGKYVEAPRLASDFDITVTGPIGRTRLTQQFVNPTDGWIEAVYVFPLPEDAAVDTLKMVIGDRVIVGDIKEKWEAKKIYEEAKANGEKATLLEQDRPNIFTNQIANIGPHETIVVQIEYQQSVRQSGGAFSLRVPTVVGPRYNPPPRVDASGEPEFLRVSGPVPARDAEAVTPRSLDPRKHLPVNPLTVTLHLNPGFALGLVKSSYHDVVAEALADDRQVIRLAASEFADRDFEIAWRSKADTAPSIGLFAETVGRSDYALAVVTPPAVEPSPKRLPREVVFVIDNSGSMGGASMRQAKASLQYALERLTPADRFNVIRFDDTMDVMFPDTIPATPGNVATAKALVGQLEASGGTEMVAPFRAALHDPRPRDREFLRQVVFLTDGAIGNEDQIFDILANGLGRSRVFMVGIGSAPNSFLMARAAEIGRGSFTHIGDTGEVEERMRALFAKLEEPVMTDLTASFDGAEVELTPEPLPDVYRDEPLLLLMKAPKLTGRLTLTGVVGGKPWSTTLSLDNAETGAGVAKLWARSKIDEAEVAAAVGAIAPDEADNRILTLALEHHLVSRVTSLVAVDKTPARAPGAPLARADVPLNLPAGWDFEKVFGKEKPALERHAGLDATLIAASPTRIGQPAEPSSATVDLPEGGTLADLFLLIGMLLAALSALMFAFSRRQVPA